MAAAAICKGFRQPDASGPGNVVLVIGACRECGVRFGTGVAGVIASSIWVTARAAEHRFPLHLAVPPVDAAPVKGRCGEAELLRNELRPEDVAARSSLAFAGAAMFKTGLSTVSPEALNTLAVFRNNRWRLLQPRGGKCADR